MRKKVSISGILLILMFFTSLNTVVLAEVGSSNTLPPYACTDVSAPDIFLDLSEFNGNGTIRGYFYEPDSGIDLSLLYESILINDYYLNTSEYFDVLDVTHVTFEFNANDLFNKTEGFHNNVSIRVFNTNDLSEYSLQQGGGAGGGGNFGFCDTVDCWGPYPLMINDDQKSESINDALNSIDNTAPLIDFNLTKFYCCWEVLVSYPYDPESGPTGITWAYDDTTYLNTTIVEAMNVDYVSTRIILNWDNSTTYPDTSGFPSLLGFEPTCTTPTTPTTETSEDTDFPYIGSFLTLSLIAIYIIKRRRKKH